MLSMESASIEVWDSCDASAEFAGPPERPAGPPSHSDQNKARLKMF